MNSESIYRAKQLDNKRWVEGVYMKHINRTPCPIGDSVKLEDIEHIILFDEFSDWNMPRGISYTHVTDYTVCRYSGKRDKNGHKIFEGDIISYETLNGFTCHSIVKFGEYLQDKIIDEDYAHNPCLCLGWYVFVNNYIKPDWPNDDRQFDNYLVYQNLLEVVNGCEVIGNIFDNQELIVTEDEKTILHNIFSK